MIVWTGFGFLVVVFAGVGIALGAALGATGLPEGVAIGSGLLLGAIGNWFAGRALNDPARGREMIDAKTGQRILLRSSHTLFWIPMQWFSVLMVLGGIGAILAHITGGSKPSPSRADTTPVVVMRPS